MKRTFKRIGESARNEMQYVTGNGYRGYPLPNLIGSEIFICNETGESYKYDGIIALAEDDSMLVLWHHLTKDDNGLWTCNAVKSDWFTVEFVKNMTQTELEMFGRANQKQTQDLNIKWPEFVKVVSVVHPSSVNNKTDYI